MTRRVQIFFNRDVINDYVSELKLSFISIGLVRVLVVHLAVGIHVAYVADQVHVTKFFNSTNVVVDHVASRASI